MPPGCTRPRARWPRAAALVPLLFLAFIPAAPRKASAQPCPCPGQPGTNYRSIGTNGGTLTSGTGTVAPGGAVVTPDPGGPAGVGQGDVLTLGGEAIGFWGACSPGALGPRWLPMDCVHVVS